MLRLGWIKTRPAQKLLVRVKFTGNPRSYKTRINVNVQRKPRRKVYYLTRCR